MREHQGPRGVAFRWRAAARILPALVALALTGGCARTPGIDPPPNALEFPIAAVVSAYDPMGATGPDYLFVANSNYEIAYNAGTLQTYDLNVAVQAIQTTCVPDADLDPSDCQLLPEGAPAETDGTVAPIVLPDLVISEVRIGSYADGIALGPDGDRLYLPVRSDVDLTHVDVDPATGTLSCGSTVTCDTAHTTSDQSQAGARDIELPTDPVALTAGPLSDLMGAGQPGTYIMMAHRIGAASLFVDLDPAGGSRPLFIDTLAGLPAEIVTTTVDPVWQLVWAPSSVFPLIARVGIGLDMMSTDPELGTLFDAGSLALTGVDTGSASRGDMRDVAFDPRPGNERVYVASRRPDALFVADREPDGSRLRLYDLIEVGNGPSRLQVATFDVGGTDKVLAFVSCFDSRDLYVVDVDQMKLLGVVTGMSGPFELQVDVVRQLVYVVDFRVSTIRFVTLEPLLDCLETPAPDDDVRRCSPDLIGMIGQPIAPQVLQ